MGATVVIILVFLGASLFLLIWPLQWAARTVKTERQGMGWCLLALVGAHLLNALGLALPVYGSLIAFLLSALAFAGILGTTFLRGIGVALLYTLFSVLLLWFLLGVAGLSLVVLLGWP
jgi:hypothetical protein